MIAVDPDFQGLGLGRQLTVAGLDAIAGRGVTTGMLYVDAANTAALGMYERLGFHTHRTDVAFTGTVGVSLYGVDRDALAELLDGEPRYRVEQVWHGLYSRLATVDEMTDLPARLRQRLGDELPPALELVTESVSDRGDTVKFLWRLTAARSSRPC